MPNLNNKNQGIFLGGLMLIFVAFLAYVACTLSIATMQAVLDQGWAHKRSLFAVSFKLFGRPGRLLQNGCCIHM